MLSRDRRQEAGGRRQLVGFARFNQDLSNCPVCSRWTNGHVVRKLAFLDAAQPSESSPASCLLPPASALP